jgi:tRNA-splicing ligase RtcB
MVQKADFKRLGPVLWEIPSSFRSDMRVPVRVFADAELLEAALGDRSIEQAINAATLPGLVSHISVMPDVHQGYGFPIGGVGATLPPDGVISPGGIGYDINCGVRLLGSQISLQEAEDHLAQLCAALYRACPSGVGGKGRVRLNSKQLDAVMENGSQWALKHGYATPEDVARTEEGGCLEGADPAAVSPRAKERGLPQLCSLGAGNHFIEIDVVDELFHTEGAQAMGLVPGTLALQIHCGSRGFGHQICSDYVRQLQGAVHRYGISLPDRELVCAPLGSPEGRRYFGAMAAAANYAFCNRQILAHFARTAFEEVLAGKVRKWDLHQIYDIAHNIGKMEEHMVEGKKTVLCVHRKGATRAFGPGFAGLPSEFRQLGQPVLVPGSMGTSSWVMLGTHKSMELSFGSSCHGAGRLMSRTAAKKSIHGRELLQQMESRGIHVQAGSMAGLAEEAPQAYKDVDSVVEVVVEAGIALKVARLRPLAVIKG